VVDMSQYLLMNSETHVLDIDTLAIIPKSVADEFEKLGIDVVREPRPTPQEQATNVFDDAQEPPLEAPAGPSTPYRPSMKDIDFNEKKAKKILKSQGVKLEKGKYSASVEPQLVDEIVQDLYDKYINNKRRMYDIQKDMERLKSVGNDSTVKGQLINELVKREKEDEKLLKQGLKLEKKLMKDYPSYKPFFDIEMIEKQSGKGFDTRTESYTTNKPFEQFSKTKKINFGNTPKIMAQNFQALNGMFY
jgi:hypothetical protein